MATFALDGESLSAQQVVAIARWPAYTSELRLQLSQKAVQQMARCRQALESAIAAHHKVYGVTTGFGALQDRFVSPDNLRHLQENLVHSHAAGVGPPLDEEVVRAAMLVRANTLARGYSGIRLEPVELLLRMIEGWVHPIIPSRGSVGASGDLAPLAHLAAALLGRGEATWRGERLPTVLAMHRAGLEPLDRLEAKDGVALVNGTAFMAATLALAHHDARRLVQVSHLAAAMSLEALGGKAAAYSPEAQQLRPHPGQIAAAARLRALLEGSEMVTDHEPPGLPAVAGEHGVQDPYSLRCVPQVHGAAADAISYVGAVVEVELNSVSDNPLVFPDGDGVRALSQGNFHGAPLAVAADVLGIAVQQLATISERRTALLLSGAARLPPFLTPSPGLNSGLMLAQYTAAALVSENKVLAHPASVDTIPTSANYEDHVSMGMHAALKARQMIQNVQRVLAIELLCAVQALDFRRRMATPEPRMGIGTARAYRIIRQAIPFLDKDTPLAPLIDRIAGLIASGNLDPVDAAG